MSLVGCNGGGGPSPRPIDSTAATTTVNQRVDQLIVGLADSTAQLDTTDSTSVASQGISSALGSSSCPSATPPASGPTKTATGAIDDAPGSTTQGLDDLLRRIASEAKDHVFRQELVEVEDGNQVIYKVDPSSACGSSASCVDNLTRNPIRFVVTANSDDSLDVALWVGADHRQPGTAVLSPSRLSLRVDLAQALAALRLFVAADQQGDLPDRLSGVVEASIDKRSTSDFVVSWSVLDAFDLLVGQAKGKPVAVTVQASSPTAQVTIDSAANTLGYVMNLGAVDVHVAGAAVCGDTCGSQERTGTFAGHLGGWTGQFTLAQGASELTFAGLGLGNDTSYVALNDDRLGTLDVNPNDGRKLSMTFKKTDGGTLVTFDPVLDIKLALMLNKLSQSLRVDMPDWLSNEVFEVMLGGAAKPSILVPGAGCSATGSTPPKSQLQVVSGDLKLSASGLASAVDVGAGMCLLPVDGVDSKANPFSQVKSGTCQ